MNDLPLNDPFRPLDPDDFTSATTPADAPPDDAAERIAKARALENECVPIAGTPGAGYFEGRAIDPDRLPGGVVGWHEPSGSVLFVACDAAGETVAVQRVFLNPDGTAKLKPNGKKDKRTNGAPKGAAMLLPGTGAEVLLSEGPEDAVSLWQATGKPVCCAFGVGMLAEAPLPNGAVAVLVADNDPPDSPTHETIAKAIHRLSERGFRVKLCRPPAGVKDANDLLREQGAEAVKAMVAGSVPVGRVEEPDEAEPPLDKDATDKAEIARLAALSSLDYDRERIDAANSLGCRSAILDALVKKVRAEAREDDAQGTALKLPSPEPWPHSVDGAALLADLTAGVLRYVVMEAGSAEAIAMWVLHAHCLDAFPISPKLAITSPEKRCGKTTCMDVVAALVPRPLRTVNPTGPAIFRTIEAMQPTLLMDEADTFLSDNDDLRGILNSGHRRSSAWVIRLVGDNHEPRQFSTWAATVIAMIGRLPDTLEDRSIPVVLRRKLADEAVAILRADRTPDLDILACKAARWAADNFDHLGEADPIIPTGIHNRAADNWRPLLAIADAAGGEWPVRARRVAEGIFKAGGEGEQSAKVMLLEDIQAAFEDHGGDRLSSADLVAALVAMEGRPWCEWKHGKPITQNSLARQLQPFGLTPDNLRVHGKVVKGYRPEQFRDAFARYIPIPPRSIRYSATNRRNTRVSGRKRTATKTLRQGK